LSRTLPGLGELVALGREELNLADPDQIRAQVRKIQPHLIVNAAAYTAVDQAESEAELAFQINGIAPGILAEEALKLGAGLVHYSTDYVFDGQSRTPYNEDDSTAPLGAYGRTKLAGEEAIRRAGVPHLILRTSGVYATRGQNFLLTMQRLAREGKDLRVVNDQVTAPTWCREIAEATRNILAQTGDGTARSLERVAGTYHLSSAGETNWYEFARSIFDFTGLHPKSLTPIPTSQYPTPARRPPYSILSNEKVRAVFGIELPDWKSALRRCLVKGQE